MADSVYDELVDAVKRHFPMQFEQLDDIQEDQAYLTKLLETVDGLPLTFNFSKPAEQWFNDNRENYIAHRPMTAPDGFHSVVPPEPEPAPAPVAAAPEPQAAKGSNGHDQPAGKKSNWTDEARAKKAEQMRQWQAKRKAEKAAAKEAEEAQAAAAKPARKRLNEPLGTAALDALTARNEAPVEAPAAPERRRLPLRPSPEAMAKVAEVEAPTNVIEPESDTSGRHRLVALAEAPAVKKTRGRKPQAATPSSRMCQVYAELLKNSTISPAELCTMMNERGVQVAEATVKVARSTIPNFVEAAKLVGHWVE